MDRGLAVRCLALVPGDDNTPSGSSSPAFFIGESTAAANRYHFKYATALSRPGALMTLLAVTLPGDSMFFPHPETNRQRKQQQPAQSFRDEDARYGEVSFLAPEARPPQSA